MRKLIVDIEVKLGTKKLLIPFLSEKKNEKKMFRFNPHFFEICYSTGESENQISQRKCLINSLCN